jgi:phosphoribosyl-ATP pyrophosphohydrolase/phosphoribosyl-AMP cyclohydrolase
MRTLNLDELDFEKSNGLIPAIVQHADTRQVLMLGYMNLEAVQQTLDTRRVTFYSRSHQQLWEKGATSGNYLLLESIHPDCDQDTLLVLARPTGPVCHLGDDTCFQESPPSFSIYDLERVVEQRSQASTESSYTARLIAKGVDKVAQKVGEEAVETVIEAIANRPEKFKEEAADLLYHLLVLLRTQGNTLADIERVLEGRHQPTP